MAAQFDQGGAGVPPAVAHSVDADGVAQPVSQTAPMPVTVGNFPDPEPEDVGPESVVIVGDPAGDYAGINILEAVVDPASGLSVQTAIGNWPKNEATPAAPGLILSDAPLTISSGWVPIGKAVMLDTQGYQRVDITTQAFAGTVLASSDGITWQAVNGQTIATALGALVTSVAASTAYTFPAIQRYLKFTATTAGTFTAFLRNVAYKPSVDAVNLAAIAGTAPVSAGVAGILTVGGNIAVGSAPTANPVPLAWDGTNTRRILTDASSGGVVLGSNAATNGQSVATFTVFSSTTASSNTLVLKAGAGRLTMLSITQGNTQASFLHLCNATAVTTGTTASVMCFALPATVGTTVVKLPDGGLYFSTGISCYLSGGIASTDNTAVGATPSVLVNAAYI